MTGYERRWDFTAAQGDQGELFARWAANGLRSGASLEVKTDAASWRTGNVYIEYECFKSGQWVASGIDNQHTRAELWAHIILGPIIIFAPTEYVRWVAEHKGERRELTESDNPTRGFVIPIPRFVAALVGLARDRAGDIKPQQLPKADPSAPFGRDANGVAVAPYGYTKDRRVRLQPGGRRVADEAVPPALWGDPGATRDEEYEPQWPTSDGGEAA